LLETVHQATRALLYITSVREVTEILAAAVHRLGGQTTPASQADSWALPIDLSFGDGEPILPVAEPLTLVRMQPEQVLPGLVEGCPSRGTAPTSVRRPGRLATPRTGLVPELRGRCGPVCWATAPRPGW
jgi:hypothetical protein